MKSQSSQQLIYWDVSNLSCGVGITASVPKYLTCHDEELCQLLNTGFFYS